MARPEPRPRLQWPLSALNLVGHPALAVVHRSSRAGSEILPQTHATLRAACDTAISDVYTPGSVGKCKISRKGMGVGMGMDPIIAVALHTFTQQEEQFLAVIAGLPNDALNWRPGPDTNSLAVLVVHTWGAAESWMARAGGHEIARDRDAEFHQTADGVMLATLVRERAARVRAATAALRPDEFATLRTRPNGETFPVAYCLIHALEHTQEHLGQALLTRQLWEQTHGQASSAENDDGYRVPLYPAIQQ